LRPTLREIGRALAAAPRALWVDLPGEARAAGASGRMAQVEACVRGHLDGWHDRPLPLAARGLRPGPPRT
jgi:hypothetical protein